MASIGTAIRLNDMMSAPLEHISKAMNMMLSTWQDLDSATAGGLDIQGVEAIRSEIDQATRGLQRMEKEQEDFNQDVKNGSREMDGLTDSILGAVGAFVGLQTIGKLADMSDQYTQIQARLSMIVDEQSNVEELNNKIFASAQRARASYTDMADTVAKLSLNAGDAFNSNNETILFAENLNKLFAIAGTEQASIASASLQLTQALGSGVLRGEEFNAVFEAAPNIMQTVADYMNVPIGKLRQMAQDGQITADVVKNALLGATDEINAQFEGMPMTWAQVWQGVLNRLYSLSIPLLNFINALAQNWSVLEPIIFGVAAALAIYLAATKGVELATRAWAAAQGFLNTLMSLNPIAQVAIAIVLVIALIAALIAAINKVAGTTYSVCGVIVGALAAVGAFIVNLVIGVINGIIQLIWTMFVEPYIGIIEWILNICMGGFDSFGAAVANLIGQIIGWFLSLGEVVTKIIDAIFGTNWTGGLNALKDKVVSWGKNENSITLDRDAPTIDYRMDYGDAYNAGYDFGAGIGEELGGMFSGSMGTEGYSLEDLTSGIGEIPAIDDIATNTGDTAKALEVSSENLKYMRDLAEQEVINRFTTAEITVNMGGVSNTVNQNMDLDGVMDYMVTGVQEAMERTAEGVHN